MPLVILGPTASGKSDLAMAYAAQRADVEIVAVDAMQVYKRMDIGTAKPTAADRELVVHHCVDLVEPSQPYTVAEFARTGRGALREINARGAQPLLVAGTGLYLRALIDPLEIPGQWPEVRERLENRAAEEGSHVLYAQLAELDPTAAARMEPSNSRRVVRALEVTLGAGRPFSSFGSGLAVYHPTPFVQIGLRWPRDVLEQRITERVHRMIAAGFVDEVARLAVERVPLSVTARQALGYREIFDHLDGKMTLDEAVALTILRTRQFAVRQERWFRRDPRIRWVDVEHDPVSEGLPALLDS